MAESKTGQVFIFRAMRPVACCFDDLRQLPYHEELWRSLGPEVARWEAGLTRPVPPDRRRVRHRFVVLDVR